MLKSKLQPYAASRTFWHDELANVQNPQNNVQRTPEGTQSDSAAPADAARAHFALPVEARQRSSTLLYPYLSELTQAANEGASHGEDRRNKE